MAVWSLIGRLPATLKCIYRCSNAVSISIWYTVQSMCPCYKWRNVTVLLLQAS